jgi:hypothetical protein
MMSFMKCFHLAALLLVLSEFSSAVRLGVRLGVVKGKAKAKAAVAAKSTPALPETALSTSLWNLPEEDYAMLLDETQVDTWNAAVGTTGEPSAQQSPFRRRVLAIQQAIREKEPLAALVSDVGIYLVAYERAAEERPDPADDISDEVREMAKTILEEGLRRVAEGVSEDCEETPVTEDFKKAVKDLTDYKNFLGLEVQTVTLGAAKSQLKLYKGFSAERFAAAENGTDFYTAKKTPGQARSLYGSARWFTPEVNTAKTYAGEGEKVVRYTGSRDLKLLNLTEENFNVLREKADALQKVLKEVQKRADAESKKLKNPDSEQFPLPWLREQYPSLAESQETLGKGFELSSDKTFEVVPVQTGLERLQAITGFGLETADEQQKLMGKAFPWNTKYFPLAYKSFTEFAKLKRVYSGSD